MNGDLATETVAGLIASGRIFGEAQIHGLVAAVDVRVNRATREWAVLTVDDGTGRIDVHVFPKTWPTLKPLVAQGKTAAFTGRLNQDKTGELQLFAAGPAPAAP
ncbi:OB-fold nucleic acid binding domain-containing protein [Streptacidiphilus neutrinimicus]|uniref:OB-fold nucleic acid binding domain-containing protein n=1 Tax=Streptacidiphilus neutrinimicus TaxID=105420 RepID=UPI0005AA3F05|nr:OB-fold nucleic acid binding domain-containing protein [Streptacidiphilus neutrinimicus]